VVTYVIGEGEAAEHQVDHPPLFACREHKNLLKFTSRFVDELLSNAQDVMPGNPDEIATAFLREAGPAYRLPEFLIPPKIFLFNPRGLRGAEALPFTVILVDRKFFGIPARYLTPDRFEGCDECAEERAQRRPVAAAPAPRGAAPRPPGGPSPGRPTNESGVRRMPQPTLNDSGAIRRPPTPVPGEGSGVRRLNPGPPPPDGRPGSAPPRPASRPGGPPPNRPGPRPPTDR
jgi:hypothetical protein